MEERYSKIMLSSLKVHIFDHSGNKVLCGLNRWGNTPFRIYKTKFNANIMFDQHTAIAERRGYPNPYKFTCRKCNKLIGDISYESKSR